MLSLKPSLLALLFLGKISSVAAIPCTDAEKADTDSTLLALASINACTRFATPNEVFWTCDQTECASYVQVAADELPDCEYVDGSSSVNKKQRELENLSACGFCTLAQDDESMALYKAAASDPACPDSYVLQDKVHISWYCDTPCQDVMEDLYTKVPDCTSPYTNENEKDDLTQSITSCHNGGLPDRIASNAGSSSGTNGSETTTAAPGISVASASSGSLAEIVATNYSTEACSAGNVTAMIAAVRDAASSSDCSWYSTESSTSIAFSTFCLYSCATVLTELAGNLSDCFYEYQQENIKKTLTELTNKCSDPSDWRRKLAQRSLKTESATSFIDFTFYIDPSADLSSSSSASSSASLSVDSSTASSLAVGSAFAVALTGLFWAL